MPVTSRCAERGRTTLRPHDINMGPEMINDLSCKRTARDIVREIQTEKPLLVPMGFPCTAFCNYSDLNYVDNPEMLAAMRKYNCEKSLTLFEEIMIECIENKTLGIGENPWTTRAVREEPVERVLRNPNVDHFKLQQCAFGLRSKTEPKMFHQKDTLIMATIADGRDQKILRKHLEKMCPGGHEHRRIQGNDTNPAGHWPKKLADAMINATIEINGLPLTAEEKKLKCFQTTPT